MIIFNLEDDNNNGLLYMKKADLEQYIKIICSNVRESDGVSYYDENKILILLPDTETENAQLVSANLMNQINLIEDNGHKQHGKKSNIDVEIVSFPEKSIEENLPVDNVSDQLTDKKTIKEMQAQNVFKMKNSSPINLKKNSFENLNLTISSQNGSLLSMPVIDTMLFSDELFPNFSKFTFKFVKRTLDLVLSLCLLILLSPVLIITGLIIKLTSPGPILFSQPRVGYKGRQFKFLKFRSMRSDSDDNAHKDYMEKLIRGKTNEINNGSENDPHFKLKNDARITPIGKLIRKTSIDELPQLWNVLVGNMSLVGPRPPIPYEVKAYDNWHHRRVLDVKPGVSGLWQVSGRNKTTFNEMVRLDIKYLENWSLILDFKILLKTAKAVFYAEGH
jgi:exopolysaccharide biosynthesis polyprenyl glycosylphosphotransferase